MPVTKVRRANGRVGYEFADDAGEEVLLVSEFLRYLENGGKSPNTIKAYAHDLQYLVRFCEREGITFDQFRPRHSVAFLEYLRTDATRAARGIAKPGARRPVRLDDSSVSRAFSTVSSFYEFLIVSEMFEAENPVLVTEGPSKGAKGRKPALGGSSRQKPIRRRIRVRSTQRVPRPMAREDVESFLATLTTLRDRAIFLLCVNGGLRPAEALTLRLSDIQYGQRRVIIRFVDEDPRGLRTKSRVERIIDLYDPYTLPALSAYVMHERPQGATTDLVFLLGRNGKRRLEPVSYDAINRLFARRLDALGLRTPWTTPHALRHTHATELFENGMRDMTLQKRLGHASTESTKIYTRVSDKTVRDDYQAALRAMQEKERRDDGSAQ